MSCRTCSASARSSARSSGDSDASSRDIAAIRAAICSSSSSSVWGLPGKKSPWRCMKPLEVVGLAAFTLFDHPVQLGEHVAEAREVLGRHRAQTLGHAAEVRAHHLLADVLQQLVEGRLRLGVGEPVVAQL